MNFKTRKSFSLMALVASLALASGCQSAAPGLSRVVFSKFSLGQMDAPELPSSTQLKSGQSAASSAVNETGKLTVNFSKLAKRERRVLYTAADVDHVVVTLRIAGQADIVQTVAKAAIVSGQTYELAQHRLDRGASIGRKSVTGLPAAFF